MDRENFTNSVGGDFEHYGNETRILVENAFVVLIIVMIIVSMFHWPCVMLGRKVDFCKKLRRFCPACRSAQQPGRPEDRGVGAQEASSCLASRPPTPDTNHEESYATVNPKKGRQAFIMMDNPAFSLEETPLRQTQSDDEAASTTAVYEYPVTRPHKKHGPRTEIEIYV